MGAARGDDVLDWPALGVDHHKQTTLDATNCLNARLAILSAPIGSLEGRPLEQSTGQGEIETAFGKTGIALTNVPTEIRMFAVHSRGYTLLA